MSPPDDETTDLVFEFLFRFFPAFLEEDDRLLEGISHLVLFEVRHALAQQHHRLRQQLAHPQ